MISSRWRFVWAKLSDRRSREDKPIQLMRRQKGNKSGCPWWWDQVNRGAITGACVSCSNQDGKNQREIEREKPTMLDQLKIPSGVSSRAVGVHRDTNVHREPVVISSLLVNVDIDTIDSLHCVYVCLLCLCVCVYQYRSSDGRVYGFFAWLASLPLSFSLWSTIEERTGWHSLKEGRRQFGQRAADLARTRRSTRNTWWATAQIERNRNKNIEIYIIKFRRLLLPPVYDWLTDWLCMCVCVCVV